MNKKSGKLMIKKPVLKKCFAQIPNFFRVDNGLSLEACGFLMDICSLPPDWEYSQAGIMKKFGLSERKYKKLTNELKEKGIMTVHFTGEGYVYSFTLEPEIKNARTEEIEPGKYFLI